MCCMPAIRSWRAVVDSDEKADVMHSSAAMSNDRQYRCIENLASEYFIGVYQGGCRVTLLSSARFGSLFFYRRAFASADILPRNTVTDAFGKVKVVAGPAVI